MEVSSYGKKQESSKELKIHKDITTSVENRHVLIVDDVADTNRTMADVYKHLMNKGASSIETFALLEKPSKCEVDFKPNYVGFRISDVWVEGYGMDSPVDYAGLMQEHGRANMNIVKGPTRPGLHNLNV